PAPPGRLAGALGGGRGQVVLFSGTADRSQMIDFRDTWTFDGQAWTQQRATGPSARQFADLVFVPDLGESLLFGGYFLFGGGPNRPDDTWTWDGASWIDRTGGGLRPSGHDTPRMVYDEARREVVLFGGSNLQDTWLWSFRPDERPGHV